MTDKPKRGRGRPRKEKIPIDPNKCISLPPDYVENMNIGVLKEDNTIERLYPPDNLSKTEKLAWLTKNRLK